MNQEETASFFKIGRNSTWISMGLVISLIGAIATFAWMASGRDSSFTVVQQNQSKLLENTEVIKKEMAIIREELQDHDNRLGELEKLEWNSAMETMFFEMEKNNENVTPQDIRKIFQGS